MGRGPIDQELLTPVISSPLSSSMIDHEQTMNSVDCLYQGDGVNGSVLELWFLQSIKTLYFGSKIKWQL